MAASYATLLMTNYTHTHTHTHTHTRLRTSITSRQPLFIRYIEEAHHFIAQQFDERRREHIMGYLSILEITIWMGYHL